MSERNVRIGLIGCGGRLRSVLERLQQATERTEVVALFDPHPESIELAMAMAMADKGAIAFETYQEVVQSDVDWIMVGSWNCFHAEHVVAAFEAGKHVFCEKPLATSVEDCIRMRDAWEASGKHFTIGFTLRYSPHYRKIKEIIDAGHLGRIVSMEFNETLDFNHGGFIHSDWRRKREWAGTHLLEKCCHDIDLVNWMLGSVAVKAASFGGLDFFTSANAHQVARVGQNSDGKEAFQTWPSAPAGANPTGPFTDDKDILDNQVAILQYANGARATFHTNCNSAIPERRMYICGTEGALRADVIAGTIETQRIGFDTQITNHSTDARGGHGGGDTVLGESLASTMLHDTPPMSTLHDGMRSAIVAFGVDCAQDTGEVYDLMPLWERAGIEVR